MLRIVFLGAVSLIVAGGFLAASVARPEDAAGDWKLVWHDEFDRDGTPARSDRIVRSGGEPAHLQYPARFELDWVRVYQRQDAGR